MFNHIYLLHPIFYRIFLLFNVLNEDILETRCLVLLLFIDIYLFILVFTKAILEFVDLPNFGSIPYINMH